MVSRGLTLNLPVVAIIGRPNVGKSALFNRLLGRRQSIVVDRPGVTRDRIYGEAEWSGRRFTLIDTGGMDPNDPDLLRKQVFEQANKALDEADLVMMTVDGQAGPHPLDYELAKHLRKSGKPVLLVVNKAESYTVEADRYQFASLGLGEPMAVSAIHGTNSGDLLDEVLAKLPPKSDRETEDDMRLALVGRPNVGKSSILNCILGEERSLVHHEAGTTRDAVDTLIEFEDKIIRLIDTAGLRKRAKVEDEVEFYSNLRALNAVQRAQVGVLVLDATQPIAAQDQKVAGEIQNAQIASVIVINKWDLIPGTAAAKRVAQQKFVKSVSEKLDFLSYSTVLFVSAMTGDEIHDILAAAIDAHEQWSRRIDTSTLNLVIREAVALKPPPTFKTQQLKVLYVAQQKSQPPTVVFKVNSPKLLHFSYRRYLENKLREAFGFVGSPIITKFER